MAEGITGPGKDKGESEDFPHKELTNQIIRAAFQVSNTLGCGFLEKVYENALAVELRSQDLNVQQQVPVRVLYRGQTVGDYCVDMIVQRTVLIETKAAEKDSPIFIAQTLNYLKATGLPVGLVLNFGQPRLSYRRLALTRRANHPEQDSSA